LLKFFKNVFNKKSYDALKKSNYYAYGINNLDYSSLSIQECFDFANSLSLVMTVIDNISDEISQIQPYILQKKSKEYLDNLPILEKLQYPSQDIVYSEFIKSLVNYYLITGNVYIYAKTTQYENIQNKVLDLQIITPDDITLNIDCLNNIVSNYVFNSVEGGITFYREFKKNQIRYIAKGYGEIWHIRDFNIDDKTQEGNSKLSAIKYEIEQYLQSNNHNLALLKNGARPSGLFTSENPFTQDQKDEIKKQFNKEHSGTTNTAKTLFLHGGKYNYVELSKSLKDMDFKDMKRELERIIINRFKYPLPLMLTDNQKYDNMDSAKLQLYDNVILPLNNKIFQELTLFLFPFYSMDLKTEKIDYNPFDIKVLKDRIIKNNVDLYKNNILTLNETRKSLGYNEIDGGDSVLAPTSLIPIEQLAQQQQIEEAKKAIKYDYEEV